MGHLETIVSRLQGINLYLVGMMGVGKTSLGQPLAQALGYQFFDTDTLIEQVAHCSIPEIFAQMGEAGFRDLEAQVLAQLAPYQRLVVATGGGIVMRRANWGQLQQGLVVWLDVPVPMLYDRLKDEASQRPLLQTPDPQATLEALMQQRRSLYTQADLHLVIAQPEPVELTLDRLLNAIPTALKVEQIPGSDPTESPN